RSRHFDLAVVEAWRAIEARLGQVLLSRRIIPPTDRPHALFELATRKGILREPALSVLEDLRRHWNIAVGTDPLTREAASEALSAARHILATVPVGVAHRHQPHPL